ncbi:Uncharacterized protein involved in propionate catabolism [Pelotomaculum thermopropionicum SI]|uniref:Uncharacterized protein involved in propionate catabolism n=1 Tax=Pelotomaculum thermopropionicum (strain DSM 13744 / JCM 10971 / SI) TaxID=370438 RepID=A5CZJ6_PELTS|nr:Uncharacterized protein involved in propionate catabolism [Pelotomaculum thermopropionicum SI]
MDAAYLFARNFRNTNYEKLPADIIDITKKQVLDYFAVALGGANKPGVKELVELAVEWGGASQSSIISWGYKVPTPNAAQINATMAHTLDYDDVHETAIMHPGVIAIPTAISMAEYIGGISGKEFITAVALGTDFICRLGLATRPGESIIPYGWHQTSLYGYVTSAAIAGRLLGLNEEGIVNAIGIAYHQSAGNAQCVKDGALTKRMGPGFAVRGGITSALMAQKGITGAKNCLEGDAGFYKVYHDNKYSKETLIGDLGFRFEGKNVSIKPYPCCRGIHPFIDAASKIVNEHDIKPEDVDNIVLWCGPGTLNLLCAPIEVKTRPRNFVDSQFSAPWGVAAIVARRRAGLQEFTPEAIKSSDLLEVACKISVEVDPSFEGAELEPGRVRITLKDGRAYTEQVDLPLGTPSNPLSFEDCERKFYDCINEAEKVIPEENAEKLVKKIKELENVNDVNELVELVVWD